MRLLSLLRLRLEADLKTRQREKPTGRFTVFVLRARGEARIVEPGGLFGSSLNDPEKALEALAQVRAEFGEDSLVRLEIRSAHLPRNRYRCQPVSPAGALGRRSSKPRLSTVLMPETAPPDRPALVRRIYDQSLVLPHRSSEEPDGWLLRGIEHGPVETFAGPYRISGGWWRSASGRSVRRDYFFVRLKCGDVCWVFFDREQRSWFLEGRLE